MTQAQSARHRTLLLVLAQVAAVCALSLIDLAPGPGVGVRPPALVLGALFTVGGLLVFHLECREEAHEFTLAEVPLVIGLFAAGPVDLVVGRLISEIVLLCIHPRQRPLKVAFNVANSLLETVVALVVFRGIVDAGSSVQPRAWVLAVVAVCCADLVSALAVGLVIRWHGGDLQLRWLTIATTGSAVANSSLGVLGALLLEVHVAALALLGVVAAAVYLSYRGYARLVERYASLQVLHQFSESVGGVLVPAGVIEAMLLHARKLLRADVAELIVISTTDGADVRVRLAGERESQRAVVDSELRSAIVELESGRAVWLPRREPVPRHLLPLAVAFDRDDFVAIPVRTDEALCLFVVAGRMADVSTFDEEDARLFLTLANHASTALEKNRLIERLRAEAHRREHQALHDELTGLPNRANFYVACTEALASDDALCVLLMDLDSFKEVNDTLGHSTGDELLVEIGRRVAANLAPGDVVARLGGDEFVILLRRTAGTEAAVQSASRFLDAVQAPVALHGVELDVRASVGVALAPDHGADPQTLLQRADVAMYVAKRDSSGVVVYSADVDHHSPRRLRLAGELRRAIDDHALVTCFQPKADLLTGVIVGVEALVRWEHPENGPLSPVEFVPVAEQTGLITPLTMVVLRQSLSAVARWRAVGHDLGVAVNVSARSLLEDDFVDLVEDVLLRAGVPRGTLTLEITESSIMSNSGRALAVLERLAALGIHLSIDDFGTGYSSLSYLQRLPVHELKVDQSFVFSVADDAGSQAIVRSVVEVGHSLGLRIVAEGVENQRAWDALASLGCDIGQGYYLSRPVGADVLLDWLTMRSPASVVALA